MSEKYKCGYCNWFGKSVLDVSLHIKHSGRKHIETVEDVYGGNHHVDPDETEQHRNNNNEVKVKSSLAVASDFSKEMEFQSLNENHDLRFEPIGAANLVNGGILPSPDLGVPFDKELVLPCPHCHFMSPSRDNLSEHLSNQHALYLVRYCAKAQTIEGLNACTDCDFQSPTLVQLCRHAAFHHSQLIPWTLRPKGEQIKCIRAAPTGRVKCIECSFTAKKTKVTRHFVVKHKDALARDMSDNFFIRGGLKPYGCGKCCFVSREMKQLGSHFSHKHIHFPMAKKKKMPNSGKSQGISCSKSVNESSSFVDDLETGSNISAEIEPNSNTSSSCKTPNNQLAQNNSTDEVSHRGTSRTQEIMEKSEEVGEYQVLVEKNLSYFETFPQNIILTERTEEIEQHFDRTNDVISDEAGQSGVDVEVEQSQLFQTQFSTMSKERKEIFFNENRNVESLKKSEDLENFSGDEQMLEEEDREYQVLVEIEYEKKLSYFETFPQNIILTERPEETEQPFDSTNDVISDEAGQSGENVEVEQSQFFLSQFSTISEERKEIFCNENRNVESLKKSEDLENFSGDEQMLEKEDDSCGPSEQDVVMSEEKQEEKSDVVAKETCNNQASNGLNSRARTDLEKQDCPQERGKVSQVAKFEEDNNSCPDVGAVTELKEQTDDIKQEKEDCSEGIGSRLAVDGEQLECEQVSKEEGEVCFFKRSIKESAGNENSDPNSYKEESQEAKGKPVKKVRKVVLAKMEKDFGISAYFCPDCQFNSNWLTKYKLHYENVHQSDEEVIEGFDFKCFDCEFQSSEKRKVINHFPDNCGRSQLRRKSSENWNPIQLGNPEFPEFQCRVCDFTSNFKSRVKCHMMNCISKDLFFQLD